MEIKDNNMDLDSQTFSNQQQS